MNAIALTLALGVGFLTLLALCFAAVTWVINELERKLGRELTTWECLLVGACFKFALIWVLLMPERETKKRH